MASRAAGRILDAEINAILGDSMRRIQDQYRLNLLHETGMAPNRRVLANNSRTVS